jgi:hypothetical protein
MHSLPESAADRFGVFTVAEALKVGWTGRRLRCAEQRGELVRLHRGIYRAQSSPYRGIAEAGDGAQDLTRMAEAVAAVLLTPGAVASHNSAAALHGLPVLGAGAPACVTIDSHRMGDLAGVHLHRAGLPASHICSKASVQCTTVARTVVDIGREHGVPAGIVAADAALHAQLVSAVELDACLAECAGWPNLRRARLAVAHKDARSESPLESLSRLAIAEAGLAAPELQTVIRDRGGRFVARVDFYWDESGVIGEADGKLKYIAAEDLYAEKRRQEQLEDLGLIAVRWGWTDLAEFDRVVQRLRRASARGLGPADRNRQWIARPTMPLRASG